MRKPSAAPDSNSSASCSATSTPVPTICGVSSLVENSMAASAIVADPRRDPSSSSSATIARLAACSGVARSSMTCTYGVSSARSPRSSRENSPKNSMPASGVMIVRR